MTANYEDFILARANLKSCRHIFEQAFADCFAVGTPVKWMRGGSMQFGEVTSIGYGSDRIKVRNIGTYNEYWLYVSTWGVRPLERGPYENHEFKSRFTRA